ncbi:MAG: Ig-like domain-containing protein [Ruminococcus sp.]|nr:Ig-like domain-containing protein [Ruminococcus sp.]
MKKFTAFLLVVMLCVSCFSPPAVSAVEEESDYLADYDYIFGNINDEYTLAYKSLNQSAYTDQCFIIGNYYFYINEDELSLYIVNGTKEVKTLDMAYGEALDDNGLETAVNLINKAKKSGVEPFSMWNIVFVKGEETTDTDPAEPDTTLTPETTCVNPTVATTMEPAPEQTDVPEATAPPTTQPPTVTKPRPTEPTEPTTVPTARPTKNTEEDTTAKPKPKPDGPNPTTAKPTASEDKNSASSSTAKKPKLNLKTATLKCGKTVALYVKNKNGKKVKFSSSNKRVAKVSKKGLVTTLKKGVAKITAKVGKKKLYCTVRVVSSPKLSGKSVTVRRGRTAIIKITGRAPAIKNTYKSTKKAKILGKRKSSTFKIRGLRRGKTTVKVKVNGIVFKIKVKVT